MATTRIEFHNALSRAVSLRRSAEEQVASAIRGHTRGVQSGHAGEFGMAALRLKEASDLLARAAASMEEASNLRRELNECASV